MRRREFIAGLGSAAAWPLVGQAQQRPIPVIGFLGDQTLETRRDRVESFLRGLAEAGFTPGNNAVIEYLWAEGHYDRLPGLAEELVRRQVSVIAAPGSTGQAYAAIAATTTIPIVFAIGADPVEMGLVGNIARPGKNITGVTALVHEVIPKRVQLLRELVPDAKMIAMLVNPTSPSQTEAEARQARFAVGALGLHLLILNATHQRDFEQAFVTLLREGAKALVISDDPLFTAYRQQLIVLAARYGVPTIYHFRDAVEAGGLISYGGDALEAWREAGTYTGRILKGEKPADLPVQLATKVELAINLKTAEALGLTVPIALLTRADRVIE